MLLGGANIVLLGWVSGAHFRCGDSCQLLPAEKEWEETWPSNQMPKVALMFLTRGPMHLEAIWQSWLEAADGAMLYGAARHMCLQDPAGKELYRSCTANLNCTSVVCKQALFTIYVHAPPDHPGWPKGSIWNAARISAHVTTRWADHSLVTATRALLAEALKDPLNMRFILLSESDVPLYDPITTYSQLLNEQRSRVNACQGLRRDYEFNRWSPRLQRPGLNITHWRKSSQWFAINRKHAAVVVKDTEINDMFERYCYVGYDPDVRRRRFCISDEHYLPTLLAFHGLGNETVCGSPADAWGVAAMKWTKGAASPISFRLHEVNAALFHRLRAAEGVEEAQLSADRQFTSCARLTAMGTEKACSQVLSDAAPPPFVPMLNAPKLTARKFPPESAKAVLRLFHDEQSGLNMWGLSEGQLLHEELPPRRDGGIIQS